MKKVILVTGANGMLAKQLGSFLKNEYSVRFLTRKKTKENEYLWDIDKGFIDPEALVGVHTIIHLAGTSIASNRWSNKTKDLILSSRVESSELLLKELQKHQIKIETFISASATGFYGTKTTSEIFTEESPNGSDFLSEVCLKWENSANSFLLNNIARRVVTVRTGIIFSKNEGALKKISNPIKYGVGAALGTGNQYAPWIHIHDLVKIYKFILEEEKCTGPINAVSPHQITNLELTKEIAKTLHKTLFLPKIPTFILKLLFGEMSLILLEGSQVSAAKIMDYGFTFEYEHLSDALKNLFLETK